MGSRPRPAVLWARSQRMSRTARRGSDRPGTGAEIARQTYLLLRLPRICSPCGETLLCHLLKDVSQDINLDSEKQ